MKVLPYPLFYLQYPEYKKRGLKVHLNNVEMKGFYDVIDVLNYTKRALKRLYTPLFKKIGIRTTSMINISGDKCIMGNIHNYNVIYHLGKVFTDQISIKTLCKEFQALPSNDKKILFNQLKFIYRPMRYDKFFYGPRMRKALYLFSAISHRTNYEYHDYITRKYLNCMQRYSVYAYVVDLIMEYCLLILSRRYQKTKKGLLVRYMKSEHEMKRMKLIYKHNQRWNEKEVSAIKHYIKYKGLMHKEEKELAERMLKQIVMDID